MPAPKIEWTDDLCRTISDLYTIEGKSAREIAEIVGGCMTKNMVISKLYHLGKMRSGKGSKGEAVRTRKQTYPKRERVTPSVVNEMWGMEEDARRVAFAKRAARAARDQLRSLASEG